MSRVPPAAADRRRARATAVKDAGDERTAGAPAAHGACADDGVDRPEGKAKPLWRVWLIRVAVGGVGGALCLWAALNAVHQDAPRPLWGGVHLPSLPEGQENGWQHLYDHPDLFGGVDTRLPDQTVRNLVDAPADGPLPTSEQLIAVREALAGEPIARAWAVCAASLRAPAFMDACPLDFEQRCPALDVLQCHRIGGSMALVAAAEGRWNDAGSEVDRILSQSLALLGSARSTVVVVAAFMATEQAMGLAVRLGRSVPAAFKGTALEPLRRTLARLDDSHFGFDSAAIGEYLVAVHGLDRMARGELDRGSVALPGFFCDTGATLAELNRIYEPVQRAPGRLAAPDLPVEPYTSRFGWWFRNPLGKLYLDVVLPPRHAFEQLLPTRERVLRARDAAREAVGSLESVDVATESEAP